MRRFFIVLASVLLASCSSIVELDDAGKEQGKASPVAVGFEAYVNRATKAGQTGDLTTDNLKTAGFGVLGYSSNGIPFNERLTPDFMYNLSGRNLDLRSHQILAQRRKRPREFLCLRALR